MAVNSILDNKGKILLALLPDALTTDDEVQGVLTNHSSSIQTIIDTLYDIDASLANINTSILSLNAKIATIETRQENINTYLKEIDKAVDMVDENNNAINYNSFNN